MYTLKDTGAWEARALIYIYICIYRWHACPGSYNEGSRRAGMIEEGPGRSAERWEEGGGRMDDRREERGWRREQ